MASKPAIDRLAGALGTAAAAVAAGALLLALWPAPEPLPPAAAESVPAPAAAVSPGPPLEPYGEIFARPIFNPGHQPDGAARPAERESAAEAPAVPPAPAPPAGWSLVGVALSETGRVALVRPLAGGPVRRLKADDTLEGWQVVAIGRDRVEFAAADLRFSLFFKPVGQK